MLYLVCGKQTYLNVHVETSHEQEIWSSQPSLSGTVQREYAKKRRTLPHLIRFNQYPCKPSTAWRLSWNTSNAANL